MTSSTIFKSEDQLHAACYTWFHNQYPGLRGQMWHTPNGGGRSIVDAVKFKGLGVRAGVHDILFLYNGILYGIEFKYGKNKLSPEQVMFGKMLESNGGNWWEVRDLETFQKIIKKIIE